MPARHYCARPAPPKAIPPLGTWPAGSSGSSVFIGITVPRTGTYAVQGEDELKGFMLAVEHINSGDPLIKKISPKTTKGVLGKEVKYGVADSEAKPNTAVQEQSRFISENKAILMTGSTSSAVAVALNKLAQREKVLYVVGISGSNDTTGKDCVRYSFRQCFYGQTAAAAIGPVLLKTYRQEQEGRLSDAGLHLWPHRPEIDGGLSQQERRLDHGDQPGRAARRAGLQLVPAQRRQFRRRLPAQRQLGPRRRAVDPAGQAIRHLRQDEAGDPLPDPVPRQGSRARRSCRASRPPPISGGRSKTSTRSPRCSSRRSTRNTATSRNGAPTTPICSSPCGPMPCERAGTFYPPEVIKAYEAGQHNNSTVGDVYFRAADHQLVRPGHHRPRQGARRDEEHRKISGK